MVLNIIDVFKITNKTDLCYMVEYFDGWEIIEAFTGTGKASGDFKIIEREKLRSAFHKPATEPTYIGFIAIETNSLINGEVDPQ